jgi:cytochrome oxidase assembly protein ShyY1
VTRFLAPRLLPWHLLIVTIAAGFTLLGVWQLGRHDRLVERNELRAARLAAAPASYREIVPALDPDAPEGAADDARYRPVFVEGTFLPDHEVLLRGRTLDQRPGYHVLTPLRLAGSGAGSAGRAVLVDRGWIPFRYDEPGVPSWAPPEGTVVVLGRLMPEADAPEGPLAAFAPRDPAEGPLTTVARPDVERLQAQVPVPLEPFVIEATAVERMDLGARTDEAEEGSPLPALPPAPGPEAGPHLGYAIQWFFFAGVAIVGYALLLRRRLAA